MAEFQVADRVIVVSYGEEFNLTCNTITDISADNLIYAWTFNDEYLDVSATTLTFSYFDASAVLVGGRYQCYVSSLDATITAATSAVIVVFAPFITEGPQSMSTTNGSYVGFNCTAAGYPAPILEWYRVSSYNVSTIQDIMSSAVELPYGAENNTIAVNSTISYSTLTIDPVYYNDYGYYICVATFPVDSIVFVYDCCSGDDNTDSAVSINEYDISSATLTGL